MSDYIFLHASAWFTNIVSDPSIIQRAWRAARKASGTMPMRRGGNKAVSITLTPDELATLTTYYVDMPIADARGREVIRAVLNALNITVAVGRDSQGARRLTLTLNSRGQRHCRTGSWSSAILTRPSSQQRRRR